MSDDAAWVRGIAERQPVYDSRTWTRDIGPTVPMTRHERDRLVALAQRNTHALADSLTREWLGYLLGIEMALDEHGSRAALRMLRELRARMESRLAGAT